MRRQPLHTPIDSTKEGCLLSVETMRVIGMTGTRTATEAAQGITGEQLRVIERYVVPLLLDAIGEALTATEADAAECRLRRVAIAALRDEVTRVREQEMSPARADHCSNSALLGPVSDSRCLERTLRRGEES